MLQELLSANKNGQLKALSDTGNEATSCLCVFCRETRRLLDKLLYFSSQNVPVTVVQVCSWYLLRHLHAKNDEELINVSLNYNTFIIRDHF